MNKAVLFIHSKTSSKRSSSSQLVPLSKSWANLFNLNIHTSWAHEIPCLGNLKLELNNTMEVSPSFTKAGTGSSAFETYFDTDRAQMLQRHSFSVSSLGGVWCRCRGKPDGEAWKRVGEGPWEGAGPVLKDKKEFLPFLFSHELHTRRHLCTASVQQSNRSRRVKTILFAKG